ncbi:MAG: LPS assembly lipoprotein LptE [Kiritimatiellia bacterium]
MKTRLLFLSVAALLAAGCSSYRWTSRVPDEIRTVAVPVFENRTQAAELGPVVTQYVLREFQREGTFSIRRPGDSSIEVQGVIRDATRLHIAYDRAFGTRASEYRYVVTADVSLVNKDTGKILVENRPYKAETTFQVQNDLLTGQRNAAARIAQELARQIVDDVLSYPYNRPAGE